jgi:hypothetical protein
MVEQLILGRRTTTRRSLPLTATVAFLMFEIVFGALVIIPGVAPDVEWSKVYEGTYVEYARSAQQTSDEGYIIAGGMSNSSGALLLKTDLNGNIQWNRTYRGSGIADAYSVRQTTDGGYIVAGYTTPSDALDLNASFMKMDQSGNLQWNKTYGGNGTDWAWSVQATTDGGYILAGVTSSYSSGFKSFWLVKTDSNGTMQWNRTYGESPSSLVACVEQTSDQGYILAGTTGPLDATGPLVIKTDSSGNTIWRKTMGIRGDLSSAHQTSDGGYVVVGTVSGFFPPTPTFTPGTAFLVKLDPSGNIQWKKTYAGTAPVQMCNGQQTSDGGYILAGMALDSSAADGSWLIKTDLQGYVQWERALRDASGQHYYQPVSVEQTNDGSYMIGGYECESNLTRHFWLAKVAEFPSGASVMAYLAWSVLLLFAIIAVFTLVEKRSK